MFGWFKRPKRYVAKPPKPGKRDRWWVQIVDRETGKPVFQSSPPGHASREDARAAIKPLLEGIDES